MQSCFSQYCQSYENRPVPQSCVVGIFLRARNQILASALLDKKYEHQDIKLKPRGKAAKYGFFATQFGSKTRHGLEELQQNLAKATLKAHVKLYLVGMETVAELKPEIDSNQAAQDIAASDLQSTADSLRGPGVLEHALLK